MNFFNKDIKQIANVIVLNLIFYSLFRIFSYLTLPEYVKFPYGLVLNSNDVNQALVYLILSISLFSLGIIFFDRFKHALKIKKFHLLKKMTTYKDSIFIIFMINILFAVVSFFYFEYSFYNWHKSQPIVLKIANLFFDINTIFIFSLIFCFKHKKYISLSIITFIFLVFFSITGKRSFCFFLFFTLASSLPFIKNRFKYSFKKGIFYSIIFFLILSTSFIATNFRYFYSRSYSINFDQSLVSEKLKNTRINEPIPNNLILLFNRLGQFDYDVIGHSDYINSVNTRNYFNLTYLWKVLVNAFWIGDPYKEATLNTSRLLPLLIEVHSYNFIKKYGYNSDIYGISVVPFFYFDLFYGSLFIFLLGIFFGFIYHMKNFFPSLVSSTFHVFTLSIILPIFLFSSGLDWSIFNLVIFGFRFLFALFLLSFFQLFFNRFRI
jgi:hypothetical protein